MMQPDKQPDGPSSQERKFHKLTKRQKDLDKERDKTSTLTEKTIQLHYDQKDQNDSFLDVLASMKETLIRLDTRRRPR